MGIALLSAQRSKDPYTQVGACIVNQNKRIVWIGYNWFPRGCSDDEFPREKSESFLENRNTYVVHSEANAILNCHGVNLEWCTLYVWLFPCNECTKLIIQSWIKKIVYLSDKNKDNDYYIASLKMLKSAWIELLQLTPREENIVIDFSIKK